VICGKGARVRIYCLYDEKAISGGDANKASLGECPTNGKWAMSIPADADDKEWLKEALVKKNTHVTVYEQSEALGHDDAQEMLCPNGVMRPLDKNGSFREILSTFFVEKDRPIGWKSEIGTFEKKFVTGSGEPRQTTNRGGVVRSLRAPIEGPFAVAAW